MFQAFVIVLREGFEAFLIVSIIYSYLKKVSQASLVPAVWWGTAVSLVVSVIMGFVLSRGVNEPLWEGTLGVIAAIMVTSLTIHMWKHARTMKKEMETRLGSIFSIKSSTRAAYWGVFLFTVFMIAREGMETALMLIQVPQGTVFLGVFLGFLAVLAFCVLWVRCSSFINVKLFFQVTGIFLLLFVAQILIYSFHEFCEAGLFPHSEVFHLATEPYSPTGTYGKWFSVVSILICAGWLAIAWIKSRFQKPAAGKK